MKKRAGFTLAELLIALAILGVIATFTIPKVLQAQQSAKYRALAKEAISTISGAYQVYKSRNAVPSDFTLDRLFPYINSVKTDVTGLANWPPGHPTWSLDCSSANLHCLRLHNGDLLVTDENISFGGTTNNHALKFWYNPLGQYTGNPADDSIEVWLFYNGKIMTGGNIPGGVQFTDWGHGGPLLTNPGAGDADWFGWD